MPYLSSEDLNNLHKFYSDPTEANYTALWAGIGFRTQQSKEFDFSLSRLKIDQFKMIIDQKKDQQKRELEYKSDLEKQYANFEKELANKAEQEAIKQVEKLLSELYK